MKKGFTLVELLAIIVILAIILAIAVPSISNLIESSKTSAFISDEKMMTKAVKTYIGINDNLLPHNVGETREITLSELQNNNYISTITSPGDRSKECNGYVLITKLDADKYDYRPYLNCENNVGSSSADGLVAYFPFDDFEEPTTNLWNQKQEWHLPADGDSNPIQYNITVSNAQYFTLTSRQKYYSDDGSTYPKLLLQLVYTDGTIANFPSSNAIKDGEWHIYSVTGTRATGKTVEGVFGWVLDHDNVTTLKHIDVEWIQLEAKGYQTPFTASSRTGTVYDYSLNNNNSTLALSSTPRWTNDAKGGGAYKFNGSNNVITTSNINLETNITSCLWAKPYTSGEREMLIHGNPDEGLIELFQDGTTIHLNGASSTNTVSTPSNALKLNTWNYVCGTISGSTGKIYVNGELKATGTVTPAPSSLSRPLNIGAYKTSDYSFDGILDEVRIYNRTLSLVEIKQLYNREK